VVVVGLACFRALAIPANLAVLPRSCAGERRR